MIKFIKSLFTQQEKVTSRMFFDSDNITPNDFKLFLDTPHKKTFVKVGSFPKVVVASGVPILTPLNIGKEASDMLIAMLAMEECCTNKHLKELVIVSTDGDMVELLATLADKFPAIKFTMFSRFGKPMATKALEAMKNISSVNFRYFNATRVL